MKEKAKILCKLATLSKILVYYEGRQLWVSKKLLKAAKNGFIYFEKLEL